VLSIDQQPVLSDEDLNRRIAGRQPGTVASLEVWREGAVKQVVVKLGLRKPTEAMARQASRATDVQAARHADAPLGINVRDLDEDTAEHLRIPFGVQGVLVTEVAAAGPARLAQVRTNHVILEVNRLRVRTADEFHAVAAALKPGEAAALLVYDRTSGQRVILTVVSDSEP
jgi:serine protease Do